MISDSRLPQYENDSGTSGRDGDGREGGGGVDSPFIDWPEQLLSTLKYVTDFLQSS